MWEFFVVSSILTSVGSLFATFSMILRKQWNYPMIFIMLYGFPGTILVGVIWGACCAVDYISELQFWKSMSKMRDFK